MINKKTYLTPRQLGVFKTYLRELLDVVPVDDEVLDTVSCLFKMKRDCDEDYVKEGFEFMDIMTDWLKQ